MPTFLHNYAKFAEDAAQASLTYDRYLLALAEQEVAQRDENRKMQRIKAARFPVLKELADFDFSCVPSLNKQRVLELARGEYLAKAESILLVGNPGSGENAHRHRPGAGCLPPGPPGAFLQRRRPGQRADPGPG